MSTSDKSTESLRCVHFALRKVAPRGGGKRCKRPGSSIADLSRRSSFHRLLQQGNNRRARRVGFGGRLTSIWSQISSATLEQKSPVKQNCAAAASSPQAEKWQPFCETWMLLSFASEAYRKLYAPYVRVNAVVATLVQTLVANPTKNDIYFSIAW